MTNFTANLLKAKPIAALKSFVPKEPAAHVEPVAPGAEAESALKRSSGIKNPTVAHNKELAVTSLHKNAMHRGIARGFRM